jgi:hypothetical protein
MGELKVSYLVYGFVSAEHGLAGGISDFGVKNSLGEG